MDLRGIANGATSTINPNESVTVLRSTGFTMGAGAKQIPQYAAPVTGIGQVQALDSKELEHISGMNLQGDVRAIYLRGNLAGVIRPNQTGGDIVQRAGGTQTWLIVKVLETWPDWCKCVIVLQGP